MLDIFKYFFGIVAIIIFVYLLVIAYRSISLENFNIPSIYPLFQQGVSVDNDLANVNNSSFVEWVKNMKPLNFAPIQVVPNTAGSIYSSINEEYVEISNSIGNSEDFDRRWGGRSGYFYDTTRLVSNNLLGSSFENESNTIADIAFNLPQNSTIKNYQVVTGYAWPEKFRNRSFNLNILDADRQVIGGGKMFINGDIDRYGNIPFRGVVVYYRPRTETGYIASSNNEIVLKINFREYRSTIITKMPEMLFPSR